MLRPEIQELRSLVEAFAGTSGIKITSGRKAFRELYKTLLTLQDALFEPEYEGPLDPVEAAQIWMVLHVFAIELGKLANSLRDFTMERLAQQLEDAFAALKSEYAPGVRIDRRLADSRLVFALQAFLRPTHQGSQEDPYQALATGLDRLGGLLPVLGLPEPGLGRAVFYLDRLVLHASSLAGA